MFQTRPRVTRHAIRSFAACTAFVLPTIALFTAERAPAQISPGNLTINLETVASGLTAPIFITNAGDGSNRLFVLEQVGRIRIIENGVLLPTPFLDISSDLPVLNAGFDERGLLGLAFHPNYTQNGRFFVRHSRPRTGVPGEPCFGTSRGCHEEVLEEFTVSANPNIANPTGTILFRVDKPQFNHNSGNVAFGPDGYLYFTLGDGGGANDGLADVPPSHGPIGNGQSLTSPLGKMLRIDVNSGVPYGIPPANPFVGVTGLDEIFAYGLRNPYRFCFDDGPGGTNQLIVADVGQNQFEEIDIVTNGGNYGWVFREGFHCFDPFNPNTPPATCTSVGHLGEPLIPPIAEYSHAQGISITGGYVYRGSRFPALQGLYLFGDWSTAFAAADGQLLYIDYQAATPQILRFRNGVTNATLGRRVTGFGRDEAGDVYVCSSILGGPTGTGGTVSRITLACPGDVNADRQVDESDLGILLSAWQTTNAGDLNGDGLTNESDLGILLGNWHGVCP
ncbi:MAG: PQQ-dependent sugar dehydrogenase [Phycisphaerae bacterium]